MKETIYLRVSPQRVEGMTKGLPTLCRGEIPVKLVIEVDPTAFREPVIEQKVLIQDWRQGIDIADVQLKEGIITDKEAEMIRSQRLQKMKEILEQQGFSVQKKDEELV